MFQGFPEDIPEPVLKYAFFDPGKNTGWAIFDESGTLRFFGQVGKAELDKLLATIPDTVTHFIYEEWVTRPGYKFGGSRMPAPEAIGHIQSAAHFRRKRLDKVQPNQMSIGYTRLGVERPKDHSKSHKWDAIAHGEAWVHKNRIRKEWAEREKGDESRGPASTNDGVPKSGVV